jgi:hypothetical protein
MTYERHEDDSTFTHTPKRRGRTPTPIPLKHTPLGQKPTMESSKKPTVRPHPMTVPHPKHRRPRKSQDYQSP